MVGDAYVTIGRPNFSADRGTFFALRIESIAQLLPLLPRVFRAHHESVGAQISKASRDASWLHVAGCDCFVVVL
ncbi:hypothetical protein [Bradyrhizobium genosp. P]|uniref:hypothetical protein n=1 Tax=Bradyrhizobium genosp. P TaxID=83641 RepID=UPI003CED5E73